MRTKGFLGSIDLLSIDIDGMDYWIWEAIRVISPRVVVVEYQTSWHSEESVTVPYNEGFRADGDYTYAGASLLAFVRLGKKRGYRLVGCERYCFNAFFLRNGVGEEIFPEVTVAECLRHPKATALIRMRQRSRAVSTII